MPEGDFEANEEGFWGIEKGFCWRTKNGSVRSVHKTRQEAQGKRAEATSLKLGKGLEFGSQRLEGDFLANDKGIFWRTKRGLVSERKGD